MTYSLEGLPSDLLRNKVEGKRALLVDDVQIGERHPLFFSRLKDSNGSDQMSVDGSIQPVEFFVQPEQGKVLLISQWMIYLQDEKGFDITKFGSTNELTKGLRVQFNGFDLISPVRSNGDIATIAFDFQLHTFGNHDDILVARWTFKDAGDVIRITENDKLSVIVNDDLSKISSMHVQAQGYYE